MKNSYVAGLIFTIITLILCLAVTNGGHPKFDRGFFAPENNMMYITLFAAGFAFNELFCL